MSHKQERQFGLLFAFVFSLIAFWPFWKLTAPNLYWLGGAGAGHQYLPPDRGRLAHDPAPRLAGLAAPEARIEDAALASEGKE